MASSLFFPSLNNIYSDYFAFLADGEASGFFSARPVTYQPYIGAKEKKSSFSLILLLHEWIVQITIGCSPFQPIGEKRMKSWRISSAKSFKWEGCYEQKPLETYKKMENPFC